MVPFHRVVFSVFTFSCKSAHDGKTFDQKFIPFWFCLVRISERIVLTIKSVEVELQALCPGFVGGFVRFWD